MDLQTDRGTRCTLTHGSTRVRTHTFYKGFSWSAVFFCTQCGRARRLDRNATTYANSSPDRTPFPTVRDTPKSIGYKKQKFISYVAITHANGSECRANDACRPNSDNAADTHFSTLQQRPVHHGSPRVHQSLANILRRTLLSCRLRGSTLSARLCLGRPNGFSPFLGSVARRNLARPARPWLLCPPHRTFPRATNGSVVRSGQTILFCPDASQDDSLGGKTKYTLLSRKNYNRQSGERNAFRKSKTHSNTSE